MKEFKTKTKEYNCDFCTPFDPKKQLFVRITDSTMAEIATVFSNVDELSDMSYCGKAIEGYTKLITIRDEGHHIFLILE